MTRLNWLTTLLVIVSVPVWAQTPYHPEPPGFACSDDAKVWVNTRSHVHHFEGERYYGSTKQGRYLCERQARREGDRPTQSGQ